MLEPQNLSSKDQYQLLINGEWVPGSSGDFLTATNPATGQELGQITLASPEDVDRAVEAARQAFPAWSRTSVKERADLLHQIADAIEADLQDFAVLESLDNGKPIRETAGADIPLAIDHFRYFASVIRSEEDTTKVIDDQTISIILREPVGVVAQIIPWNFPFLMAAWKLAPLIASGSTGVIHPSSKTSLSLLKLGDILAEVLPPGVVNIVTGKGSETGDYLHRHPGVDKLAFTGSTSVGRLIAQSAADRLIPSTLELGGKSANIVFPDADMDQALEGMQLGILFNQGQVCSAGSRIFIHEDIYEDFVPRLVEAFQAVQVGDPLKESTQMGSQIDSHQVERIQEYVQIGLDEGAELLAGGQPYTQGELSQGAFFPPTLLAGKNDMRIAQEEIFGPVAVVIPFSSTDEVIDLANDSDYGLAGGVWTTNLQTAFKVSRGIRTGRVWVNTYNAFEAGTPFGGYKDSGIGRETHKMALDAYSQKKNIYINLSEDTQGMF